MKRFTTYSLHQISLVIKSTWIR